MTDQSNPEPPLAPSPDDRPLKRLRAAGDVTPATKKLADLPKPLPLAPGQEPPSAVLARLRG